MTDLIEQVNEPGQTELVDVIDVCMPSISRAVFWMSGCQNLLRMKLFEKNFIPLIKGEHLNCSVYKGAVHNWK